MLQKVFISSHSDAGDCIFYLKTLVSVQKYILIFQCSGDGGPATV